MYKVIKNFTDKHTKVKYKVGDVVEFSTTRANEILTVGKLIEKVEEVTEKVTEDVVEKKPRKKKK